MTRNPTLTLATVLTIGALALAGCGSSRPQAATTPTPTPATVSATPTPSPTPKVTFAQAEKTYRTLDANYAALRRAGGLKPGQKMPASITDYATGDALKTYEIFANQIWERGYRWKSGKGTILKVEPMPLDNNHPEADFGLLSCEDGREVISVDPDGNVSHGRLGYMKSWYVLDTDGRVKQVARDAQEVTTCPLD